jgi:mono/diheme cytochrome c family protein
MFYMSSVSKTTVRRAITGTPRRWLMITLICIATAGCHARDSSPLAGAARGPIAADTAVAVGAVPGGHAMPTILGNPYADDPALLRQGRELFVDMNCSGCHGGHAGGGMGPSLRDVDWIYGSTDANIFNSISEGRANGMPAWGTRLPEQSIWALVGYVKSLRTPQEPDPPG